MTQPRLEAIAWDKIEDSSNVDCLFFDEPTETVCVRFHHGGVYTYMGVSAEIYANLRHAPSVGKYLNNVIKSFPYTRHESEEALLSHLNV